MRQKIAVIGAGISGLAAAAYAAKAGHEVHVFEKHADPGGRARQLRTTNGYLFDRGPSWYWMPDIIADFFQDFGYQPADFYELQFLDPQFELVFESETLTIPHSMEAFRTLLESKEPGSAKAFDKFMAAAAYKYKVGMQNFVQKPCHSWWEFISPKIAGSALRLDLLSNFRTYVHKYFKHPQIRALMEFPVIFLGASPQKIPAMYSLMNYGGYALGTWYPKGGFYSLIEAMYAIAQKLGVQFHMDAQIDKILHDQQRAHGLMLEGEKYDFDGIISSADYHHTETLLDTYARNYTESYWENRTFAPSCLLFYLGFKRRIPRLQHHTLFFDRDFDTHIDSIYQNKQWPNEPLFYVCCPSKSDEQVAPAGHENVFMLMPIATNLSDTPALRELYFEKMMQRLSQFCGIDDLASYIDFKENYCINDFKTDYHAYGGNAYGLANTLKQTAVLKPALRNKQLYNLFYTGQLTVPGPGVPPSIISGKIAANELLKNLRRHEAVV